MLCGSKIWACLWLGGFGLSLSWVAVRRPLEVYQSELLTGAGGSATKVTHSDAYQVGAGCWQQASVSLHVSLSTGLLECPHIMAGFPHGMSCPWHQGWSCNVLYDLASEVMQCSSTVFLSVIKVNPDSVWRKPCKGVNGYQEVRICRGILEAGYLNPASPLALSRLHSACNSVSVTSVAMQS